MMKKADSEDLNRKNRKRDRVVLDTKYLYEELLMVRKAPESKQTAPALPEGFRWAQPYEISSLKKNWAMLMRELEFPDGDHAEEIFEAMKSADEDFFIHHLSAILSPDGKLVSVVGIWPGKHVPQELRVHWMMSSPSYQSQGFGQMALQKAMADFDQEFPEKDLYLSTQAQSWPAIRMYEKNGFIPYTGESREVSSKENEARWSRARKQVLEHEGVLI